MLGHDPLSTRPLSDVSAGSGPAQAPLNVSVSMLGNPVQPRKQAGYIAPAVNLLTTTLAVAVTLVARDPLYAQRPKTAAPQHPVQVNLLETTLAPSQQAPFKTSDFGNPARARLVLQDTVSGNLLVTTLAVAPQAAPFIPVHIDRPADKRVQQPENPTGQLQTALYTTPPTLVARDPLFAPLFGRPASQQLPYRNLLTTTLAGAGPVQAPFFQTDWPNPVRRPFSWGPHENESTTYYSDVPFKPIDLTNPVLPKKVQQPDVPQNRLPLIPAPAQAPFRQMDWPNPARAVVDVKHQATFSVSLYDEAVPRNQDWPNPVLPKRVHQVDIPQNRLPIQLAVPFTGPVKQTDWANPTLARKVQQPDIPLPLLQTTLYVAPTSLPVGKFDWQNPIRRPFNWAPYESDNISYYSESTQAPFNQFDWPNPARAVAQIKHHTTYSVSLYDDPVPSNQDWPNPIRPKRVQQVDAPQNLLPVQLVVPFVGPVNQTDWPNPVLARRVQQPAIPLPLVQTTLYVTPPVPFNGQFDWPNPKPRAPYQQDTAQYQNPDMIPLPPPGIPSGICGPYVSDPKPGVALSWPVTYVGITNPYP